VQIKYINYCYEVSDMIKYTGELKILLQKKGIYKLHERRFREKKSISKEEMKANPALFTDPPEVRTGLFKKEKIDI